MSHPPEKVGTSGKQSLPHRQGPGAISDDEAVPDVDLSNVCVPLRSVYMEVIKSS